MTTNKLPPDRTLEVALTATQCPKCDRRGVRSAVIKQVPVRVCPHCGHVWTWEPELRAHDYPQYK